MDQETRSRNNTRCPACLGPFGEEHGRETCPECGYAYHRDCWDAQVGCSTPTCSRRHPMAVRGALRWKREQPPAPGEAQSGCAADDTPCDICRRRPTTRRRYYYGYRRREPFSLAPTYDIAGESAVWLCGECAKRRRMAPVGMLFVGLASAGLLLMGINGLREEMARVERLRILAAALKLNVPVHGDVLSYATNALLIVAACLLAVLVFRRPQVLLRHTHAQWQAQGYNAFLDPATYERLLGNGRIRRIPQPVAGQ